MASSASTSQASSASRFHTTLSHYYLVLFFVVITIVAMNRLENSRLGRSWTYVREDELAAEAMGVNTVRVKAIAFLLGSAWAGLAGALYASRMTVISPDMARFLESVLIFSIVVLGGVGSIPGRVRRHIRHGDPAGDCSASSKTGATASSAWPWC